MFTNHEHEYSVLPFAHSSRPTNNLVRSYQHVRWNRQADLFRRPEVYHQLDLRRLLDGNVGEIHFADFSRTRVVGYFDQVQVGITKIHRHHHPSRTVSFHRTSDKAHAARIQVGNNVRNGEGSNKANVGRTRGGLFCYQGTLTSKLLEIDLLGSEGQSFSTRFAKGNDLHAQHLGIEIASCTNIFDR